MKNTLSISMPTTATSFVWNLPSLSAPHMTLPTTQNPAQAGLMARNRSVTHNKITHCAAVVLGLLALFAMRSDADTISIAGGSCNGQKTATGKLQSPFPMGGNSGATAWGFGCTVTLADGDVFSITNGQDAAMSNAAGNSFTFSNDVTATYTGGGALSAAADTFAISIVQDYTTAAGLLPSAFSGTVSLTGNCTDGLGANSSLNAGFVANNGTNLSATGAPCKNGNIAATTANFNNVNIPALVAGKLNMNTLRVTETLTFNFEANTPQNSFISDPSTVTLAAVPEPGGISLLAIGLLACLGWHAAGRSRRVWKRLAG